MIILDDPGGNVAEYIAKADQPAIIDGRCYSACTLYTINPKTCVTKRAVLAFHKPKTKGPLSISVIIELIESIYPYKLRKWVEKTRALHKKTWTYLKAPEIFKYIRRCNEGHL